MTAGCSAISSTTSCSVRLEPSSLRSSRKFESLHRFSFIYFLDTRFCIFFCFSFLLKRVLLASLVPRIFTVGFVFCRWWGCFSSFLFFFAFLLVVISSHDMHLVFRHASCMGVHVCFYQCFLLKCGKLISICYIWLPSSQ